MIHVLSPLMPFPDSFLSHLPTDIYPLFLTFIAHQHTSPLETTREHQDRIRIRHASSMPLNCYPSSPRYRTIRLNKPW